MNKNIFISFLAIGFLEIVIVESITKTTVNKIANSDGIGINPGDQS
jgi:hypothetical protein